MRAIHHASNADVDLRHGLAKLPLWGAAVVAAIRTWWRLGGENHHLLGLGDRELHDIGLSRVDAWAAARKSRWPAMVEAARKVMRQGGRP